RQEAARASAPLPDRRPKPTRHESDQRLAAWAAEWAAPTGNTGAGPIDTSAAQGAPPPGNPAGAPIDPRAPRADMSRARAATDKTAALEPAVPDTPAAPE